MTTTEVMERTLTTPSLGQKALVEGMGTFLLTFIGCGSVIATAGLLGASYPALIVIALAFGVVLAIAVSAAMNISGGHINPAVTIGMLVTKRISFGNAAVYIASQLFGALIGGYMLYMVYPKAAGNSVAWGLPTLSSQTSIEQGILFEAIMTFVLVLAVFGTAIDPRAPKIGGFGIGLAVAVDIMAGGPITGAAMNPSRAIGPLFAALSTGTIPAGYAWYVWWIGPIVGAIVAACIYEYGVLRSRRM
jgi:MIP family channel proteins